MAEKKNLSDKPGARDRELRKVVLAAYYSKRSEGFVGLAAGQTHANATAIGLAASEIDRITIQLVELGLLRASRLDRVFDRSRGLRARLTAAGVDAAELALEEEEARAVAARQPPPKSGSQWREEWQTVLAGLIFSIVFVWICISWRKYFSGQQMDLRQAAEIFGNSLLLLGVLYTAIGSRLSREERNHFAGVEAGGMRLEGARVAKVFRNASHYSTVGLGYLLLGTLLIIAKVAVGEPNREPDQEVKRDATKDDAEQKHGPLLRKEITEFVVPFSFHFGAPETQCLDINNPFRFGEVKEGAAGAQSDGPPAVTAKRGVATVEDGGAPRKSGH